MYWENAKYNQRNQTNWDWCRKAAITVRRYSFIPATNTGRTEKTELLRFVPFTKVPMALKETIFNLISIGARIPVYLMMIGFDLSEYAAKGYRMPAGDAARRRDTPWYREKWFGWPDTPYESKVKIYGCQGGDVSDKGPSVE
jgi:hypothetical protein